MEAINDKDAKRLLEALDSEQVVFWLKLWANGATCIETSDLPMLESLKALKCVVSPRGHIQVQLPPVKKGMFSKRSTNTVDVGTLLRGIEQGKRVGTRNASRFVEESYTKWARSKGRHATATGLTKTQQDRVHAFLEMLQRHRVTIHEYFDFADGITQNIEGIHYATKSFALGPHAMQRFDDQGANGQTAAGHTYSSPGAKYLEVLLSCGYPGPKDQAPLADLKDAAETLAYAAQWSPCDWLHGGEEWFRKAVQEASQWV